MHIETRRARQTMRSMQGAWIFSSPRTLLMEIRMQRVFVAKPAVRESVPLLIGLMGPSSSGKTYSALRLATGIQRVTGGEIYCIDTESRRMLHYADSFKFRHIQFDAP